MFNIKRYSVYGCSLVILFTQCLSFSANANPNPKNQSNSLSKTEVSEEAKQLQLAYKALLAEFDRKATAVKVDIKAKKGNAKLVKASFDTKATETYNKRLRVTATAYTSHVDQTDSTPNIAAWGDRLRPGMKVIAVSRDLLNVYGLKHKQKVRIKGLEGEYMVLDKMNKRWRKKIDIYMGMNKRKAFSWGRRNVEILWNQT